MVLLWVLSHTENIKKKQEITPYSKRASQGQVYNKLFLLYKYLTLRKLIKL